LKESDLGDRGRYKAEVLNIAIEKLRRGYSPVIDKDATNFSLSYYDYTKENYPHLNMRQPPINGVPSGSSFFVFEPKNIGLDKSDKIIHKGYGAVDLQFDSKATEIEDLKEKFNQTLTDEMKIVKAGKSASIRIKIPEIVVTKSFNEQLPIIRRALIKAENLYQWAKDNL